MYCLCFKMRTFLSPFEKRKCVHSPISIKVKQNL